MPAGGHLSNDGYKKVALEIKNISGNYFLIIKFSKTKASISVDIKHLAFSGESTIGSSFIKDA